MTGRHSRQNKHRIYFNALPSPPACGRQTTTSPCGYFQATWLTSPALASTPTPTTSPQGHPTERSGCGTSSPATASAFSPGIRSGWAGLWSHFSCAVLNVVIALFPRFVVISINYLCYHVHSRIQSWSSSVHFFLCLYLHLIGTLLYYLPQGPIHALDFAPSGKFLASGATDSRVLLWDIGHGLMVGELKGHTDTVYTLKFSRDGEILASGAWPNIYAQWCPKRCIYSESFSDFLSGSMDNTVRLWDAMKAFDDLETDDFTAATGHIHLQDNSQELLLGTYMSKSTPVVHLHFTRRNLLLAAGAYNPWVGVE